MARWLLIGLALGGGCGEPARVDVKGVVRDGQRGRPIAGAEIRGPLGARARSDAEGRFQIRVPAGDRRMLRAAAIGYCPGTVELDVSPRKRGPESTVNLFSRLEVQAEYPQVGFDAEVQVRAITRCDPDPPLHWEQTAGPPLRADRMRVSDGGRLLTVRTHRLQDHATLGPRPGVVPLSRRERGDYRFEVTAELGGSTEKRQVRLTAAPTAAGVFQVPTGTDLYLNGGERASHAWRLVEQPDDSRAVLEGAKTRTPRLRPDRFGTYLLRYEPLALDIDIEAGAYDQVPRDCGRSSCHQPEAEGWKATAHAHTFRRGVTGELGPAFETRCWNCHVTGVDPGVHNGGLLYTATKSGWTPPPPHTEAWTEAPRQIRRHGSIWCSACHGPGRIIPPRFHWQYDAKYQAGVCARCHDVVDDPDANHQSWQFREWEATPMASFVSGTTDPGPAIEPGCARCHSAQGFVAARRGDSDFAPPPRTAVAVTCTTCHDSHNAQHPNALRVFEEVSEVAGIPADGLGPGALCATCHHTDNAIQGPLSAPHAPQADVLLGRSSQSLDRPRPGVHAHLADSCVTCHMASPPAGAVGQVGGHTFSARDLRAESARGVIPASACRKCHGEAVPPQAIGGYRDWDGDGKADTLSEEFARAARAARANLRARVAGTRIEDPCDATRYAAGWTDWEAQLLLADDRGRLLGDCDADGHMGPTEIPTGIDRLPRRLQKFVWDLELLERDGSLGRHNPEFAFAILRRLSNELGP